VTLSPLITKVKIKFFHMELPHEESVEVKENYSNRRIPSFSFPDTKQHVIMSYRKISNIAFFL
jgi:hypothetical protein